MPNLMTNNSSKRGIESKLVVYWDITDLKMHGLQKVHENGIKV